MKLSAAFAALVDIRLAIQIGLWPTLVSIWQNPLLLLHPQRLSRTFMGHLWVQFGNGVDENGRHVKKELITPHAAGVVLDLGAGYGHTMNYLNRSNVKKYVALEPNIHMHGQLREVASSAGYAEEEGTLQILSCGAQDTSVILSLLENNQVDTIISVLTLCSVPNPESTISNLVLDVLKPGGQLLYYEHVLSHLKDVAWWQRFWAPLWAFWFDGCRLDQPTHLYIEEIQGKDGKEVWTESRVWGKEGEPEENLWFHRVGRYVKA